MNCCIFLRSRVLVSICLTLTGFGSNHLIAQGRNAESNSTSSTSSTSSSPIDLFEGMARDQLEVKFIPQSSSQANVLITNKTDAPIHIQLPQTFAGVPILGQFGNIGNGNNLFGNGAAAGLVAGGNNGQAGQGLGGGFNQQQGQGIGQGQAIGNNFGNGFNQGFQGNRNQNFFGAGQFNNGGRFNIDPGKTRKIHVSTVCLEHGKPTPNPRMKYQLVRLEEFNPDPKIAELCTQLAENKVSQQVAQAGAWNIANGMTWQQLAKTLRSVSQYTGNQLYFNAKELQAAKILVADCEAQTTDKTSSESRSVQ